MTPQEAKVRLTDGFPVLGFFRRRAAIRALTAWDDPSGVCLLADAIHQGHADQERIIAALMGLRSDRDSGRLAALWLHWSRAPTPALARVLVGLGWHKGRPPVLADLAAAVAEAPTVHSDPEVAKAASEFLASVRVRAPVNEASRDGVRQLFSALRRNTEYASSVSAALCGLSADLDGELVRNLWLDWCLQPQQASLAMAKVLVTLGWPSSIPVDWAIAKEVLALATKNAPREVMRAVHSLAKIMPVEWPADTDPGAALEPSDLVFHAWIRSTDSTLEALISERAMRPRTAALAAMHALVVGNLEAYDALQDSDGALQTQAYALAPESFRMRMDKTAEALAQRAANARAELFQPPTQLLDLYRRNPYAVLGLQPSETTARVLMRRRDDLITLLSAGTPFQELPGYLTVALGDHNEITIDDVRAAVSRLQDEPDRCRHALMWFRLKGESDEILEALGRGRLDDAERLWSARIDTAEAAESEQQTMFNLAVLCHWRALVGTPSHDPDATDAYATLWRHALQRWRQVLTLPQTGTYVEALCAGMSDPRIDGAFSALLRAELPAAILGVNAELASAAGATGSVALASLHVRLIEESGFAPEDVAKSLDALFAPLLTPIRSLLQPLVSGSTQLTEDVDFDAMREHYMRGRSRLVALGAKARLAVIAEEAVSAGREKMLEETNALYFRLDAQIGDFWNDINYYIKVWNELMDDHNRGYSRSGQLREVHRHVADDVSELLDDFDKAVDKFAEAMRRERVGLTFLTLLDEDAAGHRADEIATLTTEENDALKRVLSWKSEARAWLTKEETNMRRNCATL